MMVVLHMGYEVKQNCVHHLPGLKTAASYHHHKCLRLEMKEEILYTANPVLLPSQTITSVSHLFSTLYCSEQLADITVLRIFNKSTYGKFFFLKAVVCSTTLAHFTFSSLGFECKSQLWQARTHPDGRRSNMKYSIAEIYFQACNASCFKILFCLRLSVYSVELVLASAFDILLPKNEYKKKNCAKISLELG